MVAAAWVVAAWAVAAWVVPAYWVVPWVVLIGGVVDSQHHHLSTRWHVSLLFVWLV